MFSFLFLKKNRHPSSSTISNQEPSRNLLLQINSLKEENQRKNIQIEAMEKQINRQQIQILTLKKSLRVMKKTSKTNDDYKIRKASRIMNKSTAKSSCSEVDFISEYCPQEELHNSMSVFDDFNNFKMNFGEPEPFRRYSFSLTELEVKPYDFLERQSLNKFLHAIKLASPSNFKEIQAFIYDKGKIPFCNEIYEFIDKIHIKLENNVKFIEIWGRFNENMLEDLIFESLYTKLFDVNEDTHAKSFQIHEKLLVLQNIVTPDLLEIPHKCRIPSVLLQLQNDIKKLNERKSPRKKLQIIAHCFKNLIKLQEIDQEIEKKHSPNADDIFPLLVLIVLNANPDNFFSNLEFINKYIRQNCLIGEEGYLLTNVKAALSFLENLDGQGLKQGKLLMKPNKLD